MSSATGKNRHVSIRVPEVLYHRLEALARDRDETVSQCARRLLDEGLAPGDRDAIDAAITTLQQVREQLLDASAATTATATETAARTLNILNVKSNLSRLIADVGRGEEIVITHAGTPRARLVPVAPASME